MKNTNKETKMTLTTDLMKKMSRQIILEELQEKDMVCGIYPLTLIEYYSALIKKRKYKLEKKIFYARLPFSSTAFFEDRQKVIVIFISRLKKIKKIERQLFDLVFLCYHEARHLEQTWFSIGSLPGYLREMEEFICANAFGSDYLLYHDCYSFEIGANLYAIRKTEEYLKRKYPDIYLKYQETIRQKKEKFFDDYFSYHPTDTFDHYIEVLKEMKQESILSFHQDKVVPRLDAVSEVFLTSDYRIKKIREIRNHEDFSKLDKTIIYMVLSSSTFLSHLSLDDMDMEEIIFLKEALDYTSQVYENQRVMLEKNGSSQGRYDFEKVIEKKNKILHPYLEKIAYLSKIDNSRKKKENKNLVLKRKEEIAAKLGNHGYLVFDLFYVMSALITLFSMICLMGRMG